MQENKTMKEIVTKLRDEDFYKRVPLTSDPDEGVHVSFDLYPTEVVAAAQKALGAKALSSYFVEIYEYVRRCKEYDVDVKKSQASGALTTHRKIEKWLTKQGVNDVFDLQEPVVLKMYLEYHAQNIESSLVVWKDIVKAIS